MKSLKSPPLSSTAGRRGKYIIPTLTAASPRAFVAVVGPCALLWPRRVADHAMDGSTPVTWRSHCRRQPRSRDLSSSSIAPILFGAIAGGALAVAGVLFQAILETRLRPHSRRGFTGISLAARGRDTARAGTVFWGVPLRVGWPRCGRIPTILLVFLSRERECLTTLRCFCAAGRMTLKLLSRAPSSCLSHFAATSLRIHDDSLGQWVH